MRFVARIGRSDRSDRQLVNLDTGGMSVLVVWRWDIVLVGAPFSSYNDACEAGRPAARTT